MKQLKSLLQKTLHGCPPTKKSNHYDDVLVRQDKYREWKNHI